MAALLANGQSENNKVRVIYSKRKETPKNIRSYFNPSIELINIQMDGKKNKLTSIPKIRKEIKKHAIENLFLHSSFAGFIGRMATIGLNIKIFYIPHCISFMRKDITKTKKNIFILLEKIASKKETYYIACTKRKKNKKKKNINPKKIKTIENAIKFSDKTTENKKTKNKTKRIVTVGGIRAQKGPRQFLEIAKNNKNHEFIWVGDGDTKEKELLEKNGITVTGWKSQTEVEEILQNCDVYLSTARWEGMPVSIIEALYHKIPVIAKNSPGNIDVIKNELNGFLFNEEKEVNSLIEKSIRISKEKLEEISKETKERFNEKRYLKEIEEIMRKA